MMELTRRQLLLSLFAVAVLVSTKLDAKKPPYFVSYPRMYQCLVKLFRENPRPNMECDLRKDTINDTIEDSDCSFSNLLIMHGVYCGKDSNCKAYTGRLEYKFNLKHNKFYGFITPNESKHADANGFHKRVPIAYDLDGNLRFADESINWWHHKVDSILGKNSYSLFLTTSTGFNWCQYAESDRWPLKTSFYDETKKYIINFYNRHTCIIPVNNRDNKGAYHYNGRFQAGFFSLPDYDMNPTVFPYESWGSSEGQIHYMKTARNEYDIQTMTVEPSGQYNILRWTPVIKSPIFDRGPMLDSDAFADFLKNPQTNTSCLLDTFWNRIEEVNTINKATYLRNFRVPSEQGIDKVESAETNTRGIIKVDYFMIPLNLNNAFFGSYDIDKAALGNLYRSLESIFKKPYMINEEMSIIAFTTRYEGGNDYLVWVLGSLVTKHTIDSVNPKEDYPDVYFFSYTTTYSPSILYPCCASYWPTTKEYFASESESRHKMLVKNVNYVDDFAYLPKCKTIVTVFGPLYNEVEASIFSPKATAPVHSIKDLGLNTLISTLFIDYVVRSRPGNKAALNLYAHVYEEMMVRIDYTCGSENKKGYVTGTSDNKYIHEGEKFSAMDSDATLRNQRIPETFFLKSGIFKNFLKREKEYFKLLHAPDVPFDQNSTNEPIGPVYTETGYTTLYVFIGIALLAVVAMGVFCLTSLRKKHSRDGRSMTSSQRSRPSSFQSMGVSDASSVRSSMTKMASSKSKRGSSDSESVVRVGSSSARSKSGRKSRSGSSRLKSGSSKLKSRASSSPGSRSSRSKH